jgi:hypothetical protein
MSIALGRRGVRVAGLVTGGAATSAALAVIGPEPKEEVIEPRGNGMLVHLAGYVLLGLQGWFWGCQGPRDSVGHDRNSGVNDGR